MSSEQIRKGVNKVQDQSVAGMGMRMGMGIGMNAELFVMLFVKKSSMILET